MGYRNYRGSTANSVLVLVAANVLLFIALLAREDLVYFFGLQPSSWLKTPWTIVTSLFIHGGIWHIATNMIALYFFGTFLSTLIGQPRFLSIYFLGGLVGNLFFMLLAHPNSIAIGASGAVFAVGGALAVMRPRLKVYIFPIPVPIYLWIALLGGLVIMSFLPNIAWQAHLGGAITGIITGYWFKKQQRIIIL